MRSTLKRLTGRAPRPPWTQGLGDTGRVFLLLSLKNRSTPFGIAWTICASFLDAVGKLGGEGLDVGLFDGLVMVSRDRTNLEPAPDQAMPFVPCIRMAPGVMLDPEQDGAAVIGP